MYLEDDGRGRGNPRDDVDPRGQSLPGRLVSSGTIIPLRVPTPLTVVRPLHAQCADVRLGLLMEGQVLLRFLEKGLEGELGALRFVLRHDVSLEVVILRGGVRRLLIRDEAWQMEPLLPTTASAFAWPRCMCICAPMDPLRLPQQVGGHALVPTSLRHVSHRISQLLPRLDFGLLSFFSAAVLLISTCPASVPFAPCRPKFPVASLYSAARSQSACTPSCVQARRQPTRQIHFWLDVGPLHCVACACDSASATMTTVNSLCARTSSSCQSLTDRQVEMLTAIRLLPVRVAPLYILGRARYGWRDIGIVSCGAALALSAAQRERLARDCEHAETLPKQTSAPIDEVVKLYSPLWTEKLIKVLAVRNSYSPFPDSAGRRPPFNREIYS